MPHLHIFNVTNTSFNAFLENITLMKISEFTVVISLVSTPSQMKACALNNFYTLSDILIHLYIRSKWCAVLKNACFLFLTISLEVKACAPIPLNNLLKYSV